MVANISRNDLNLNEYTVEILCDNQYEEWKDSDNPQGYRYQYLNIKIFECEDKQSVYDLLMHLKIEDIFYDYKDTNDIDYCVKLSTDDLLVWVGDDEDEILLGERWYEEGEDNE